jgi:hypothetical protein
MDWIVTALTALALLMVWVGLVEVGRKANSKGGVEETRTTDHTQH